MRAEHDINVHLYAVWSGLCDRVRARTTPISNNHQRNGSSTNNRWSSCVCSKRQSKTYTHTHKHTFIWYGRSLFTRHTICHVYDIYWRAQSNSNECNHARERERASKRDERWRAKITSVSAEPQWKRDRRITIATTAAAAAHTIE